MKDDRIYLRHILECLDAIRVYTAESPGRFLTDRNVLVHDYLGLSLPRIWNIIERDLPPLRAAVEMMLSELEQRGPAA